MYKDITMAHINSHHRVNIYVSGGCPATKADAVTVTDTFNVTAGLTADSITATTAFSWSKAVASTDTYGFNLANGDDGHTEFLPAMNQICGDLTSYGYVFSRHAQASMHHQQRLTVPNLT